MFSTPALVKRLRFAGLRLQVYKVGQSPPFQNQQERLACSLAGLGAS